MNQKKILKKMENFIDDDLEKISSDSDNEDDNDETESDNDNDESNE